MNLTSSKSGKFFAALQPRNPPVKNHSTLRIWPVAGEMVEAPLIEMKGVGISLQAWSTDGRLAIA
ncbi:hypothetical protein N9C66_03370 [Akkermansiaceae bacterium]|nr:hypothetical protein [Akkermansiaceae bacterium]